MVRCFESFRFIETCVEGILFLTIIMTSPLGLDISCLKHWKHHIENLQSSFGWVSWIHRTSICCFWRNCCSSRFFFITLSVYTSLLHCLHNSNCVMSSVAACSALPNQGSSLRRAIMGVLLKDPFEKLIINEMSNACVWICDHIHIIFTWNCFVYLIARKNVCY